MLYMPKFKDSKTFVSISVKSLTVVGWCHGRRDNFLSASEQIQQLLEILVTSDDSPVSQLKFHRTVWLDSNLSLAAAKLCQLVGSWLLFCCSSMLCVMHASSLSCCSTCRRRADVRPHLSFGLSCYFLHLFFM
mmetsp:Transcript_21705/g.38871  ORF Transcript_21705/g.38871 Transcript_21705/m.38871 type:complete len:133 (+) Transcript_21705:1694-2092(+)